MTVTEIAIKRSALVVVVFTALTLPERLRTIRADTRYVSQERLLHLIS